MTKFSACLWVDGQIEEMIAVYQEVFASVKRKVTNFYLTDDHGVVGDILTVSIEIDNQEFLLLNGGPEFTMTPAISYVVEARTATEAQAIWDRLAPKGEVLMALEDQTMGKLFGWLNDEFGVSWQITVGEGQETITPCVMFIHQYFGMAEEAIETWGNYFGQLEREVLINNPDGTVQFAKFTLDGQPFIVMDNDYDHQFAVTMGNSFCFYCDNQAEIDRVWELVTKEGAESQCGWMVDKFGVSWQTTTRDMDTLLRSTNPKAVELTKALYNMKKLDINYLRELSNS
ncbi:VOC family protein [Vagococcus sp. BWB3-3]|uniref:VOC family protein n=1 Tax=Vagococcus allomyrinae TaxID=2794353 RepID=A0A940PBQ9_9ENTE|nr:VOC family protein [Vagococcus allomyrinae]MBP1040536.1 VOC family protein [Vagococcus allomyrinae]